MPVSRVASARQNATALAQRVVDVCTRAPPAITVMEKDGGNESEWPYGEPSLNMLTFFALCRTAEDLTATSRRLARYESLLNDILPMVSPEVRALIDEARENDTSNGSETNDNDYNPGPPRLDGSISGAPGGRIILPLPVPSPHVPGVSRSSTSSSTFEPAGPPATLSTASSQTSQRLSPDSNQLTRLPSITAGGILIEEERAADFSPPKAPGVDTSAMPGLERLVPLPTSPSHSPHGDVTRPHQFSPG
ncbi:hypothetical protein PV08_10526 [Exophiala spinifera]|uniref:Uncharacterized protein n=1 Tax=Exophiala spinifera TaxID=91928 RepID=A0A0D1Y8B2_9EURO|nr:uncharacterized protein PV08_10526 [Exophiala spinifera]KIW11226.1 hypothetical protein PV08_10526 [Exophiala spinifera]